MSEFALEEVSVLSSIYCKEGEFRLLSQSDEDVLVVQISCPAAGDPDVKLLFNLQPSYPSCPPDISVSSTRLSRSKCHSIRQQLLERAAELDPEPMVHQLVQFFQTLSGPGHDLMEECGGGGGQEEEEEWTSVLRLDHIRSQNHYINLLQRWNQQLQLGGTLLLLGPQILIILQGHRRDIKEFCRRLKTVKVDVDASGRKCKERMMSLLLETSSPPSCRGRLQGFVVRNYVSAAELSAALQEMDLNVLYEQIRLCLK